MMMPGTKALARNNRRYIERVVRYLAGECGVRQFIDNGSGLPTRNNVHHIAQAIALESRVVYIDNDHVVLRHQRVSALAENENTAFVLGDATNVDEILAHPAARLRMVPCVYPHARRVARTGKALAEPQATAGKRSLPQSASPRPRG
jgi:hypothetical protein